MIGILRTRRCYSQNIRNRDVPTKLRVFYDAPWFGNVIIDCLWFAFHSPTCALVTAKYRDTLLKTVTIPQLQLTAVVVEVDMSGILRNEPKATRREIFWSDSVIILYYIWNEKSGLAAWVAIRLWTTGGLSYQEKWRRTRTRWTCAARLQPESELPGLWQGIPWPVWPADPNNGESESPEGVHPESTEGRKRYNNTPVIENPLQSRSEWIFSWKAIK